MEINFTATLTFLLRYLKEEDCYNYWDAFMKQKNSTSDSVFANDYEEYELFFAEQVKEKLTEIRKGIKDIRKNGKDSSYFESIWPIIQDTPDAVLPPTILDELIKQYSNLNFVAESIILAIKKRKNNIIDKELQDCMEEDKLLLIFAKNILEDLEKRVSSKEESLYHAICLRNYLEETESIKGYNPFITYFDGKKKVLYTYRDFITKYKMFLNRNQEKLPFLKITDEELDSLDCSYKSHDIETLCKVKFDESKTLEATWETLRPGELPTVRTETKGSKTHHSKEITDGEVIKRMMFFEKMGYSTKLLGKGKFAGYVSFIFGNGVVVLEKFYEDEEEKKTAKENATYIMNYKNFIEMSKLSKPEVMEYIKNTDNKDVERKYHTPTWEKRMTKIICGTSYTLETKRGVDLLLGTIAPQKRLEQG